jgi:hypothetical protein
MTEWGTMDLTPAKKRLLQIAFRELFTLNSLGEVARKSGVSKTRIHQVYDSIREDMRTG